MSWSGGIVGQTRDAFCASTGRHRSRTTREAARNCLSSARSPTAPRSRRLQSWSSWTPPCVLLVEGRYPWENDACLLVSYSALASCEAALFCRPKRHHPSAIDRNDMRFVIAALQCAAVCSLELPSVLQGTTSSRLQRRQALQGLALGVATVAAPANAGGVVARILAPKQK